MAIASICGCGDLVFLKKETTAPQLGDDYEKVIFFLKKRVPLSMLRQESQG
jgi:hypothetical protein